MPGAQGVEVFRQADGDWVVDWRIVGSILRSHANYAAILATGHETPQSEWHFYDALFFQTPDVVTYEVNWDAQRSLREQSLSLMMSEAAVLPSRQGCKWLRDSYLRRRIAETDSYRRQFRDNLAKASEKTMHTLDQAISSYDWTIGFFRGVRDLSVDFVLVGATFLSGGAALTAAGAGSLLRGTYSYQDKRNVGLAVVEASTTFAMTTISIGRAAQAAAGIEQSLSNRVAEEGVVVLIGAQFDFAKGIIEGKTVEKSMAGAAVNAAGGLLMGQVMQTHKVKGLIEKIPLPTRFRINTDDAMRLKEKMADKVADGMITSRIGNLVEESLWPEARKQIATGGVELDGGLCFASELSTADQDLLDHAVRKVN